MAHKTLVDSTEYEVTGGLTLVEGTSYSIKMGKCLLMVQNMIFRFCCLLRC